MPIHLLLRLLVILGLGILFGDKSLQEVCKDGQKRVIIHESVAVCVHL